jgi:MFS family permease
LNNLNTAQSTDIASEPIVDISGNIPKSQPEIHTLGGVPVGQARVKKALTFSLCDGIFANAMIILTDTFSVAAAVYLKAPAIAIAMLGSLPLLLSSFGQFFLPHIINPKKGRKLYVIRSTTMQSIFLAAVACSGWIPHQLNSWFYVTVLALAGFSGNLTSGLWIAWMGDLVPSQVRGRHFAWRNRIFSMTQLFCAMSAGLLLRHYSSANAPWILFASVFFTASFFRLVSTYFMSCQYEPATPKRIQSVNITKPMRFPSHFIYYCIATALMQGAVAMAGPFFNVWYIRDLKFDYFTLSVVSAATVLGTIASLPLWGKLADTIGNRRVMMATGFMISTVPLPYIISDHAWQIGFLNFYTGVCWSGYNLSNFNYLLLAAGLDNQDRKISFGVAVTGICVFVFSLLGGILATRLPAIFGWQLLSLFLLSSLLRFLVFGGLFLNLPKYEPDSKPANIFHYIPGYKSTIKKASNLIRLKTK